MLPGTYIVIILSDKCFCQGQVLNDCNHGIDHINVGGSKLAIYSYYRQKLKSIMHGCCMVAKGRCQSKFLARGANYLVNNSDDLYHTNNCIDEDI